MAHSDKAAKIKALEHELVEVDRALKIKALELELAEVKKQLLTLQLSVDGDFEKCGDVTTSQPFRFLDLPRELRDAIHDVCVVVGKVFIHKPNEVTTFDMRIAPGEKPQVQFLCVCKQIHLEANHMFLSKNTFVHLAAPPSPRSSTIEPFLRDVQKDVVRRLSITLDYRSFSTGSLGGVVQTNDLVKTRHRLHEAGMEDIMHTVSVATLTDTMWFVLFSQLSLFEGLEYLQINLQNCYCPLACHRLVEEAFTSGGPNNIDSVAQSLLDVRPAVVDVVGTMDKQERQLISDLLKERSFELQFHGGWTGVEDEGGFAVWDEKEDTNDDEEQSGDGVIVDKSDDEADDVQSDEGADSEHNDVEDESSEYVSDEEEDAVED